LNKSVKQLYSADLEEKDKNLTKEDLELAKEYIESIKNLPIYYVDMPGTPAQIRDTIYRINDLPEVRDKKLLITLDHSILVKKSPGKDQMETLYDLSFEANQIKKNIDSSFVFLSQLNRAIESTERRQNSDLHYPTKADIFGADALYQYSDVVLVPHRPEMLGIREYGPNKMTTAGFIYWHYLKVRDGDPVIAKMINDLKHNRVLEYVPPPKKAWNIKN
jgi:replicative DNA helicase